MIVNKIRQLVPRHLKSTITQILCHQSVGYLLAKIYADKIPSRGISILTASSRITNQTKASLFWRLYERAEIGFIQYYLRSDQDVIELGGSIGVTSCYILKKLNKTAKFLTLEADPELAVLLETNLILNNPNRNYTVINKAISYNSSSHTQVEYTIGQHSTSGKLVHKETRKNQQTCLVETITLAELIAENQIGEYVLVSDIEGAESGIFLHDSSSLSQCQQIIIELHDTHLSSQTITITDMVDWIGKLNFKLIDKHGHVFVFQKIK